MSIFGFYKELLLCLFLAILSLIGFHHKLSSKIGLTTNIILSLFFVFSFISIVILEELYKIDAIKLFKQNIAYAICDFVKFSGCINLPGTEEFDWKYAVSKDDLNAFNDFLVAHPKSILRQEAEERIAKFKDKDDWMLAVSTNTNASFQIYVQKHPNGLYVKEAQGYLKITQAETEKTVSTNGIVNSEINNLIPEYVNPKNITDEEIEWNKISSNYNIRNLKDYISRYPKGIYISKAKNLLQNLEAENAKWSKASLARTEDAVAGYLREFPNGAHRQDARKLISQIRVEELAWERIPQKGSVILLKNYLKAYPLSWRCSCGGKNTAIAEIIQRSDDSCEYYKNVESINIVCSKID